jgi:hypothetical protein
MSTPVTLDPIPPVDPAAIQYPQPVDVTAPTVTKKVTTGSVAVDTVTFTPISTGGQITADTLNQDATSLAVSINAALAGMKTSVNTALSGIDSSMSDQISDINSQIDALATGINAALNNISDKEVLQTQGLTGAMNGAVTAVMARMSVLVDAINGITGQIAGLSSTYETNADMAAKVAQINGLIATIGHSGADLLLAINSLINAVNALPITRHKVLTLNSSAGTYQFLTVAEGWPQFTSRDQYGVVLVVRDNLQVQADLVGDNAAGFTIMLRSNGVNFTPQPWDASVTPVRVSVLLTHLPLTPLAFNVTELGDGASVTDGTAAKVMAVGSGAAAPAAAAAGTTGTASGAGASA